MATHIIASSLPPKKTVDFSRYRIVKPAWIMDSVKAGRLLPWADYRVLDEGPRQKILRFDGTSGLSQATPDKRQDYREQTDSSYYTGQISAASLPNTGLSQVAEKLSTPARNAFADQAIPEISEPASKLEATGLEAISHLEESSKSLLDDNEYMQQGREEQGLESRMSPSKPADAAKIAGPRKDMTSEEHNAWLLSDPKLRKSSSANPEFLKQFYSESRLHHLSTWKAELKTQMQRLAADKGLTEKRFKKRPGSRSYIMHVDFDSFFCAVSLKRAPEYLEKPAVVAHSTGSGSEIASCNYVARKFGVKNGMWMKRALEFCPDIKVLPYDFPAYEEASRQFYEAIMDVGGLVQSVSVDEALIDATSIVQSNASPSGMSVDEENFRNEQEKVDQLASDLRKKIKSKTGCEVSVGIGGNILQAKVALRKAKPAGQYQLKPEDVFDVIGALKVEGLPGVAYSIGGRLEEIGVKLVKDIREVSLERLTSLLGPKTGEKLRDYSRGIDRIEVGEVPPRKSVSAEVNWGIRFLNQPEAEEFVYNLCKELERRLLNEQVKGSQMTMKIMRRSLDAPLDPAKHLGHGKCDVFNRSATFGVATHNYEAIGKEAVAILRSLKFSPGDLRGLGVQMTKLEPIKAYAAGIEGSQKKLSFTFTGPSPSRRQSRPEAIDERESPVKPRDANKLDNALDPIADDPATPKKPKIHPAMALAKAGQDDAKANTPLNVSGTQFIMPSNPDPAIMAEVPTDIRSKLVYRGQKSISGRIESPQSRSRSGSPMPDVLPSQVDAEVFNALPDDMKAEILASYGRQPAQPVSRHSPHRESTLPKKQRTPTKRGGIRGIFGKGQRQRDAQVGLFQTNFRARRAASEAHEVESVQELDPEFLAELPEDVRKEIIADHRRQRLAQQSGLAAPASRQRNDVDVILLSEQRPIQFGVPPPKISFANSGVSSTQEIKDMLDAWHAETQSVGPHRGDVEVLEKYLVRVVSEEKNLEKARSLVKWLSVVVEQDGTDNAGKQVWKSSVEDVKGVVQDAVRDKGLAPLDI